METIAYVLQVSACTGIFYLFYYLLLRRLTFFTINRWYLIITLVLSFVIPAIKVQVKQEAPYVSAVRQFTYIDKIQADNQQVAAHQRKQPFIVDEPINWSKAADLLYVIVALILFTHLLISVTLFLVGLRGKPRSKLDGVTIFSSHAALRNGSFFNYVFLNDDGISPQELKYIIAHELLHVSAFHSVDRVIAKIAQIILWFNPFVYWYANAIEANHEFGVDKKMAAVADKKMYANLLLHLSATGQGMLLLNGFSTVPLAKRITMLFNKPSNNMKKLTYLLMAPMVLVSCLVFATSLKTKVKTPVQSAVADEPVEKYRQKVKRDKAYDLAVAEQRAYMKTEEYKSKSKITQQIMAKEIVVKIAKVLKDEKSTFLHRYTITYNNNDYDVSIYGKDNSDLDGKLSEGDEVTMKMSGSSFSKNMPVSFSPAYIIKNNVKIFEEKSVAINDTAPFLYETNKVRFTDGKITDIKRNAAGKCIGIAVEGSNNYIFNLTFKSNAPDLTALKEGYHVTLRFVHEVKTSDKTYDINDWVAIGNNADTYAYRNPDWFLKFYEPVKS
ncbi:M56 family metallopeptidase [Mucilaginibacter flavus]|uniref:M56 family metallopeptidase n=1 Tax=Mucilaginibacter flavus TaxID=931504 RepID=UPI0025B5C6F6|nr:M56 family metallopeptidase [Mucilaginibacter flavus]MDN3580010.1 M56 family metallopeptidase [Mucilaginibacter flavus]